MDTINPWGNRFIYSSSLVKVLIILANLMESDKIFIGNGVVEPQEKSVLKYVKKVRINL